VTRGELKGTPVLGINMGSSLSDRALGGGAVPNARAVLAGEAESQRRERLAVAVEMPGGDRLNHYVLTTPW